MNAKSIALTSLLVAAAGCSSSHSFVPAQTPSAPEFATAHGARAKMLYFSGYDAMKQPYGNPELGVYAATANGNVAAMRRIQGTKTTLINPVSISLDTTGRMWICEAFYDRIAAYGANASGNSAPVINIAGSNVPLAGCGGVTIAPNGDVYATSYAGQNNTTPAIYIWKAGSHGNVAPTKSYAGAKTGLVDPSGIAIDAAGNVRVSDIGAQAVHTFGPTPGNVAPLHTIAGNTTQFNGEDPYYFGVSPNLQRTVVAAYYADAILAFAPTANGDVAPAAKITGPATKLVAPYVVAIDQAGYTYVGTCPLKTPYTASILVFAPGANGNAAPVQTIAGTNANISCITGITVR